MDPLERMASLAARAARSSTPPIPDSPTPSVWRRPVSSPFSEPEMDLPPTSDRPSSPDNLQSSGSSHSGQDEGSTAKRSGRKRSCEELVANGEEPEADSSRRSRTQSGQFPSLRLKTLTRRRMKEL
ncbi:hypothetical protein DAEQUDRAFT_172357 [Daedalea quercina L-15889]|uniref:Uncharacterized protein n=1 Tax=Daedalea quercina L-15889 TaxID=1314783 RepID=A0A165KJG1_9APHY|nr:hypothetical protein DAEQUDRAFT_172357 [Daedalea quercina L-15889]